MIIVATTPPAASSRGWHLPYFDDLSQSWVVETYELLPGLPAECS
jgi:hypothetical protein